MILVTGAGGFTGSRLVERLRGEGHAVRGIDLGEGDGLVALGAEFRQADVRDEAAIRSAAQGCEVVFHLVGLMPQARARADVMRAVNVGGTRNVLAAARAAGARRAVFLSSSEVYGDAIRSPMREGDPKRPIGEYGRNKVAAEALCLEYAEGGGPEVVILRPSTLVGPGIRERLFLRFLEMASRGSPLFYPYPGRNRFQMTAISDCIEACVRAGWTEGISGEAFNIGAEETLDLRDQLLALKSRCGVTSHLLPLPVGPAKTILSLLHRLGASPLEPDHFLLMERDVVMDTTRARERLGFVSKKTNLDMIAETLDWYRARPGTGRRPSRRWPGRELLRASICDQGGRRLQAP